MAGLLDRPGTVMPGTVTPGTVTPGTVMPGVVTAGTVMPGVVTAGVVTAGVVTAGVVPCVRLRTGGPADAEVVRAVLSGLSLDTAYKRFFTGLGSVPAGLVRQLLADDPGRSVLLAATGDGTVIGLADTTLVEGGAAVEIGVVLADRWQRRGLGRPLCTAALAPALAAGVPTLRAHTLVGNVPVAALLHRQWPGSRGRFDDGTLVWDLPLPWTA